MRVIILSVLYYGLALYGLLNPLFGYLFLIHIIIFRPESLVWGNLVFGRLHFFTALLVLVGWLIHKQPLNGEINESYQKKNLLLFAVFIVWLLIVSLLAESSVELSLEKVLDVVKIFIISFLFIRLINTESQLNLYVWVAVISFGMLSSWGFVQTLVGNPRLDTLWPGGSNYVAAQLALMAPLAVGKALDERLSFRSKLIFLACALSMVLCTIGTQSRGAFLGLTVGVFTFLLVTKYRVRALAAFALIVALGAPWVIDRYYDRFASTFVSEEQRDPSAESRFVLWTIAFRIWKDYPIAGVGLQNFSPVKETYADKVSDIIESKEMFNLIFNQQRYPHGVYTGMMAETGLVGIALFLILLLRNIFCRVPKQFLRSQPGLYLQFRGAQAGLIGFAVAAMFSDIQYIEMLYIQLFFVGAVKSYSNFLVVRSTSEAADGQVARTPVCAVS